MPLLIPEAPHFPHDGGAERAVWEALRDQLPDDAVLFADVAMQDGAGECEIDLLVAWPGFGLAAIEVKGGFVQRTNGQWLQGSGAKRHPIDPVRQVRGARHTLQRLLEREGLDAAQCRIAHLVALPHTPVSRESRMPDLPRPMLLDRDDLGSAANRVVRAIEDHGQGHAPLDDAAVGPLVEYLGGGLPSQVEVLAQAAENEDHLDRLTHDQRHLIRKFDRIPRLQVIGGAGTGKTWLALEQARRRTLAGDRVALLCYSRGLGRYLERVTEEWPVRERPAFVGLFHQLPLAWGAEPGNDDDSDYYERRLPIALGELAATRPREDLFDTIVVDEAQDFSELWWPSLLRCLREEETGRLTVFSDEGQRVFARVGAAPIELEPIELDENLRSSKQIAQLCGALHEGVTRPRGAAGSPVRLVDVPADEALHAADDAVDALLDEGWLPGQIAMLTTLHRHPLQAEAVEVGGWAAYWDAFFAGDDVFYGHVLGFKGLERTVVVLAINGFRDLERARTMLYTGLSRARSLLVAVGPRELVEEIGGEAARRRLRDAEEWSPA